MALKSALANWYADILMPDARFCRSPTDTVLLSFIPDQLIIRRVLLSGSYVLQVRLGALPTLYVACCVSLRLVASLGDT